MLLQESNSKLVFALSQLLLGFIKWKSHLHLLLMQLFIFKQEILLLKSLSKTSQVDKKVYTNCATPEDHHVLSSKKIKTCCMFFTIKQQKLNIINRLNLTHLVNIASIDTK